MHKAPEYSFKQDSQSRSYFTYRYSRLNPLSLQFDSRLILMFFNEFFNASQTVFIIFRENKGLCSSSFKREVLTELTTLPSSPSLRWLLWTVPYCNTSAQSCESFLSHNFLYFWFLWLLHSRCTLKWCLTSYWLTDNYTDLICTWQIDATSDYNPTVQMNPYV